MIPCAVKSKRIKEKEKLKLESSSSGFKEITRMPPVYVPEYPTFIEPEYPFMCCVGVGDRACFVTNDFLVIEMVVYNIGEKTWKSLPSFHLDEETKTWISLSSFHGTGHKVWEGSGISLSSFHGTGHKVWEGSGISLSSFHGTGHKVWEGSGMAFEPRPDMKVL